MSVDVFSSITAIISAIGVLVALLALLRQSRQSNFALGVSVLRDLEKDFDSDLMRHERLVLATFLLKREEDEPLPPHLTPVIDFFDTVGVYMHKGVLDEDMTGTTFYYWLEHYWQLMENDIESLEVELGAPFWQKARLLNKRLKKWRKRARRSRDDERQRGNRLRDFLEEELKVCSDRRGGSMVTLASSSELPTITEEHYPLLSLSFGRRVLRLTITKH